MPYLSSFNHLQPILAQRPIGRIDRQNLYSLRFIDDKDIRRGTLTQLNRGEGRHSVAGVVFSGKRGELRQRYREWQEDQLGALGLVVNMIVALEYNLHGGIALAYPGFPSICYSNPYKALAL